jgi:hypothetical protein
MLKICVNSILSSWLCRRPRNRVDCSVRLLFHLWWYGGISGLLLRSAFLILNQHLIFSFKWFQGKLPIIHNAIQDFFFFLVTKLVLIFWRSAQKTKNPQWNPKIPWTFDNLKTKIRKNIKLDRRKIKLRAIREPHYYSSCKNGEGREGSLIIFRKELLHFIHFGLNRLKFMISSKNWQIEDSQK